MRFAARGLRLEHDLTCASVARPNALKPASARSGDSANYIRKQLSTYKSGERKDPQMTVMAKGLSDEDIAGPRRLVSSQKVTAEMPK